MLTTLQLWCFYVKIWKQNNVYMYSNSSHVSDSVINLIILQSSTSKYRSYQMTNKDSFTRLELSPHINQYTQALKAKEWQKSI